MKKFNNIKIVSTGKYIPEKTVSNFDMEKIVDTTDEWIYSRTGIRNRHYSENEVTSDLAAKAAMEAIKAVNYDVNKIDLIIVATFTADYLCPSVASTVQTKLGLNDKEITCFDLNAACTGFIYALNVASKMLNSEAYKSALVIGSEVMSKVMNYEDRNTCVLFGDGAGAVIIENTKEVKPAMFYTSSKGDIENSLQVSKYLAMDGQKVYQFAIKAVEESILKILKFSNLTIDQCSKIIPHQANIRIIQSASKTLNIPMDKFFINIEEYGNTSAASIIIALDEYIKKEKNVDNQKILLVGFGGGFTWGAAQITL